MGLDNLNLSPDYMRAICILAGIFCLISLLINSATIIRHAKHYTIPAIQRVLILINVSNCFCAIYFFLGVILYPYYEFFELLISIHIASKMGMFYNGILKMIIAYEVKINEGEYKLAIEELKKENPEMYDYYSKTPIKNKFSVKRVYLLIMIVQLKTYKHIRCVQCCCKQTDVSSYHKALRKMRQHDMTMLLFILANSLLPIVNIILRERRLNHDNNVFLILKIIKLVFTIIGMLSLNNFTSNLSPKLPGHRLTAKFRILQILFMLINLQGVILGLIKPKTDEFKDDYFTIIILYLFLSFENILVTLFLKALFGLGDFMKDKIKQYTEISNEKTIENELVNIKL